jgi:hypothetical protein
MSVSAMRWVWCAAAVCGCASWWVGCDGGSKSHPDGGTDTDSDSDSDSDADLAGEVGEATRLGPWGGAVTRIVEDPTAPGHLFAIAGSTYSAASLYASVDDGETWSRVDVPTDLGVTGLLFLDAGRLVVGTDFEILVTDDSGGEWTDIRGNIEEGSMWGISVKGLAYEPGTPGRLWAALGGTYTDAPIWSLEDGEATWTPWNAPAGWGSDPLNGAAHFTDMAIASDSATAQTVIHATYEEDFSAGGGVFCSVDSGATFSNCSSDLPSVPYHRVLIEDGAVAVAGGHIFGDAFAGVYYSEDQGTAWIESTDELPIPIANDVIRLSGGDYLAATHGAGVWRTVALDAPWSQATGLEGMAVNTVAQLQGGDLLAAPEQLGLYRSEDDGDTWQASSTGLDAIQVAFAAVDPANSEAALAVVNSQNSGLGLYTESGINGWAPVPGMPLPRYTFVDIAPSGRWYAVSDGPIGQANDGVWVSADGGGTFDFIGPLDGAMMDHEGIKVFEIGGPAHLIAAGNYWTGPPDAFVMESEDGGDTWTTMWEGTVDGGSYALTDFVSLAGGGYLVAMGGAPLVRLSESGEETAVPILDPAVTDVVDLAVCFADPDVWYVVGVDAEWQSYALTTRDGGTTWSPVPLTGFEDETPAAVEVHPYDCGLLFLSTYEGIVRYTRDDGAAWEGAEGTGVSAIGMRVVSLEADLEAALLVWGDGGLVRVDLTTAQR